ncbi:hypothetical protein RJ53_09840 [Methanocalculus chunghsingensis]|uniref:Uncharacterized protein n=1 Tax=Methanocalculus chunghsingensis TaxID=156457 RepID=A0A8J7WBP2_9EURY|nr:hypothetical protein [Methanocalculus chunghsingensis]MBR1369757.1 hypothetical protein [Methanocalculus chunghsingensis]
MTGKYFAFTEIDGAIKSTKKLLWPFRAGVWLRLALIAFFVGAGGGFPQGFSYSDSDFINGISTPTTLPPSPGLSGIVIAGIGLIILAALVYTLIGAILQFVFVDCIRTRNIHLTEPFKERLGKGFRLFLFETGITILLMLMVAAIMLPIILTFMDPAILPRMLILVFLIPIFIIIALIIGIIMLFTIDFVVPIMIKEDCGVIEGWKHLVQTLTNQWMQAFIYLIIRVLAGIGAGIVMAIITFIAFFIIAIPFVIIGFLLHLFLAFPASFLLPLLIPFLILAVPVMLLITVPFITFFRTYSLKVLAKLSEKYALLPEDVLEVN